MGDQVLSIDSTKANVEYICVEMADNHPRNTQRATWGSAPQQAAIAAKNAEIATKNAAVDANAVTFVAHAADIATKDATIATNTADIATKDATIATKDADIAAKDATIAKKDTALAAGPTAKDGVEDGAVAGIAVATFIGGLLVGAIIISMILCPAARQQKAAITKSTTAGVKVEQVDRMA